ncbi:MAG: ATPase [Pseudanabaena sp. M090S1SP2A07QC]|nr:ATPase [Pseudanabaena sp. M090S1SP2A07QC]
MSSSQFRFRNTQTVGAAAAEQDEYYLNDCFVDTGMLSILLDCSDSRCILLGRTGAGKSALITQILLEEHVLVIKPDSLSLSYVSNSNVIKFFSEAGVNLNLFYRLLWRHIFVIEILKEKFGIKNEVQKEHWLQHIWSKISRNRRNELALDYLKEWGDSFWQETDYRVQEITKTFEKDLNGAAKMAVPDLISVDFSAAKKLTQEQKEEVVNRGQEVVNKVQISKLNAIVDFLNDLLGSNRQKNYYIVIDKLDEDWVEDKLRFRLIRELIEASIEFTRIENVKVIIALRIDLLDRVYRYTRDTGFQEEKYRSSNLALTWSKPQLIEVLDRRIDKLVKNQYTKQTVTHKEILRDITLGKGTKKSINAIDYMIDRTLFRPRDIIQFFNACIALSNDKAMIDVNTLFKAEGNYSRERFRALVDEWFGVYPNLALSSKILRNEKRVFRVKELDLSKVEENCLESLTSIDIQDGNDRSEMTRLIDGKLKPEEYRKNIILVFYKVGLIGLKINDNINISWSYLGGSSVSAAEIEDDSRVHIQPTFWRHFGIIDPTLRPE